MALRSHIAKTAGRCISWGLQNIAHRQASQLPGRIACSIDASILQNLAHTIQGKSVVVCGTNGKTTTTNIIAQALIAEGKNIVCNQAGANMEPGVVSALLENTTPENAVFEVDELSTIAVVPKIQPDYFVLLNLFRDQLDRSGEIDRVQDTIVAALKASPNTTLIVCADDPLSMGVAHTLLQQNRHVITFGIDQDLHLAKDRVPEARFCQVCGSELLYEYQHYAQLGKYRCSSNECNFMRPQLSYAAHEVVVSQNSIAFELTTDTQQELSIQAPFGGVYTVYNLLAAYIASHVLGVEDETFKQTLAHYQPENGRLQRFVIEDRDVILNLAKNPTGFNQNISLMQQDARKKVVYVVINDNDNDGNDISWLWDVDFERFADSDIAQVICGGIRANDMQVRLKYADISAPIAQTVHEALAHITSDSSVPLYVLTNYSALWPKKQELEKWEK